MLAAKELIRFMELSTNKQSKTFKTINKYFRKKISVTLSSKMPLFLQTHKTHHNFIAEKGTCVTAVTSNS